MTDIHKEICIAQGYVPKDCKLPGMICWLLVQKSEDPCAGCNHNREECGGRPHK